MIQNCDILKLNKQKQLLEEAILNYENKDFIVFNIEAGTGKTITTLEILQRISKKCLFVTLRNDDAIEYSEKLNKIKGNNYSIAVNTQTFNHKEFNKIKSELHKYQVIFISHEKYKVLAQDKPQRQYFTKDRYTLIIDEFVDMVKGSELSMNLDNIKEFETELQERTYRNLYVKCIEEIEDYLKSDKKLQTFFNSKKDYDSICKKINELKNIIKDDNITQFKYTKSYILKKLEELKQFYNQTCVVEGSTIYSTNRNIYYWKLSNNIILDASGKLNPYEGLGFKVFNQSKVLDHSKWTFNIVKTNTSKTAKGRAINFYQEINLKINDNTLVIGNKEDEKYIEALFKNHFGNVTGSNLYRLLKDCIICHNPNMPYRQYVLEYIYYYNKKFDNRNSWSGRNVGSKDEKVFRFKESKFEEYRLNRNANECYQAIKRVNRNMEQDSIITIYNNDMQLIEKILKMFEGDYKVNYIDNTIEFEKTKMDKYNEERKINSYASKFITLCMEIVKLKHLDLQQKKKNRKGEYIVQEGFYKKKDIANYLGITSAPNISRLFKDKDVIDYIHRHNIINEGQVLNFKNYK